jgi:hypothetical protein
MTRTDDLDAFRLLARQICCHFQWEWDHKLVAGITYIVGPNRSFLHSLKVI